MSQAQTHVRDVLTAALPDGTVDGSTRAVALQNGRVWVLQGSWRLAVEGPGETVGVVVAVAAGHHNRLDELTDQVFAALRADGTATPSEFTTQYGVSTVVPGRQTGTPADMVTVTVTTPFDR